MDMFQSLKTEWKLFGIVFAVSVVISIALIGLLTLMQQEPQQVVAPTPTTVPVSTLVPMPVQLSTVDTSDWQTYRNEEFGFEVKYPSYLGEFSEYRDRTFSARSEEDGTTIWTFSVRIITGKPSLEDYLRELDDRRTAEHIEFDPIVILKKSDIKVGPYRAVQYEIAQYAAPVWIIETYLIAAPDIIRLSTSRLDEAITDSMRELNDQILSTFRFVE